MVLQKFFFKKKSTVCKIDMDILYCIPAKSIYPSVCLYHKCIYDTAWAILNGALNWKGGQTVFSLAVGQTVRLSVFKNSKWLSWRYLVAELFVVVSHISLVNF